MHRKLTIILILILIAFILIDPASAKYGMQNGINLCITNLIPSLFPLFFLIGCLSEFLGEIRSKSFIHRLLGFCKLSPECELVFLMSLISGYPIGAVTIQNLESAGTINRNDAKQMMGFCNNAGPAFIFGVGMFLFEKKWVTWFLWGIQLLSSLAVARVLSKPVHVSMDRISIRTDKPLSQIMLASIKSMTTVCGWVLAFSVLTQFIEQYFGKLLHPFMLAIIKGIFELSSGCVALNSISNDGLRFILFNTFLSFGGLSVWMQIKSAADALISTEFYIGKFLHITSSIILSVILQAVIFENNISNSAFVLGIPAIALGIRLLVRMIMMRKIIVAKRKTLMYNI